MFLLDRAPGISREQMASRLLGLQPALMKRFGTDARIIIGIQRPDDPLQQIGGERRVEPIDALVQITIPGKSYAPLIFAMPGIRADLESAANPDRIAVAVGYAYVMVARPGSVLLGFLGRRNPAVTLDQMRDWWLTHHGPLAMKLTQERAPHGYDQFHVDPQASRSASDMAKLRYVEYDMGDSIYIDNLAAFIAGSSDPDVQSQLIEDERPFLDHTSWRGSFTDVL